MRIARGGGASVDSTFVLARGSIDPEKDQWGSCQTITKSSSLRVEWVEVYSGRGAANLIATSARRILQ